MRYIDRQIVPSLPEPARLQGGHAKAGNRGNL